MAKLKVLYVDDEKELLEITKMFLEQNDEIDVDVEQDPRMAIEKITGECYDAVVSDYQMPRMDGITLLKEVRTGNDRIPFILFTGRGREEVAIEALNSGADFYLQKGGDPRVQFRELKNAIIQLTHRKNAEKELIRSEQKYRDLVESTNSIILKLDAKGNLTFINPSGRRFFGCSGEVIGLPIIGSLIMLEDYAEEEINELKIAFSSPDKYPSIYSFPVRCKNRPEAWITWTTKARLDDRGGLDELLLIGYDVTASKVMELKLQRSLSLVRATLDSCDEGILVTNLDRTVSDHNIKFLDMWKIPTSVVDSRSGIKLMNFVKGQLRDPDAFVQFIDNCHLHPEQKNTRILEFEDGRTFEEYSAPEYVGNQVIGRLWCYKDITKQKTREKVLIERSENMREMFSNNPAIMLLVEQISGTIVHANEAACRFYGYEESELTKMTLSDLSALTADEFSIRMDLAESGLEKYFYSQHKLRDGVITDVEVFIAPINYKGRPLYFTIVHNVPDMTKAKDKLEKTQLGRTDLLNCIVQGIPATSHDVKS
jgi:PAS domain S-box-containing protein